MHRARAARPVFRYTPRVDEAPATPAPRSPWRWLALLLVPVIPIYLLVAVLVIGGGLIALACFSRYHTFRFKRAMRRAGRWASWDDIEAWLAQGPGTLIIDWPSLGWRDVHVWWTRESVARTASEHGVFPPPLAVEHVQPGSVSDGPRPCDLAFTAWLIVRYFHRHRGLATLVACTHSARARSALERRISALCAAHPHLETIETRSYEEIIIANEAAAANRSAPAA